MTISRNICLRFCKIFETQNILENEQFEVLFIPSFLFL